MARGTQSKQTQFRLPPWALEFIERAATQRRTTKTQVVLDALACLREHELEALMAEGYETLPVEGGLLDGPGALDERGTRPAW